METVRKLFFQTLLGALARPEMLEQGNGMLRTFQQVEAATVDAWNLLSLLISDDIEATHGIRR